MWARVVPVLCVLAAALRGAHAHLDGEMAELAKMLRDNCAAETGVDMALIDAANGGADLAPDAQLKCYIKCVMETAGMFTDGAVDVEAVLALLPEDFRARNEDNLRACGSVAGADDCDTAYRTQLCWQQKNRKDYFLI
ncbi:general odorant-binding protein 69a-like [Pectinophora gossypiella]|uniref:general odorant-binding protein 69a-like n=1 Tax=Pectinophora gossypiella TaxID=13191 RepID=UPI00214F4163|nr:general odorant-binding protein 69a-like [Pectinophora gossypiella]